MGKKKEKIEGKIDIVKELKRVSRKTFKDMPTNKIINDDLSENGSKTRKKFKMNDLDWEEIEELMKLEW